MSKVRVAPFSVSLDGFGAGPRQDLENPLGVRGSELHGWVFQTETFKKMYGQSGGNRGVDNDCAATSLSFENIGAFILGATCSGQSEGLGKTIHGEDGGVRIRHSMHQSLCSRILGVTLS